MRREKIKDFRYFGDPIPNDVTGAWNISDRRAEKMESGGRGSRNAAVERVDNVEVRGQSLTAPDQRLLGIQVKPNFGAFPR